MVDDMMEWSRKQEHHIDVSQQRDIKYWTEVFGVTEEELKEAVRAVGTHVGAVRSHIEKRPDRGGRTRETPDSRPPRS